jgi:hypothetical protein
MENHAPGEINFLLCSIYRLIFAKTVHTILAIFRKDSVNRMQNKMNLFIFYAEVQPIFAFRAKVTLPPLICKQTKQKTADSHEPAVPIIIYE